MNTRDDKINCEFCKKSLNGEADESTHTKQGHNFCSYACFKEFYGGTIPESEEFKSPFTVDKN